MRSISQIYKKSRNLSLTGFLLPYMLIYLADSSLTYMLPIHADTAIDNKWLLGIILSLTSVGSIIADFVIPTLFKKQNPWQSLRTGILIGITFPITMFLAISQQSVFLFAIATLISGMYFEFLSFGLNEFMAKFKKPKENEKNWGIVSIVESIIDTSATFVGSGLVLLSLLFSPLFLIPLQIIALLSILSLQRNELKFTKGIVQKNKDNKSIKNKLGNELKVFVKILKNNFIEVLILLIILSFDALIWTYGALWSIEKFGQDSNFIITTIYQVCMIFGSIFLLRFNFQKIEKGFVTFAISVAMLILSSIFIFFNNQNTLFLVVLIAGSLVFSFGFPLIASMFTSIAQSNKKNAEEIIGLKRLMYGLSYIIAPIIGGFILNNHSYNHMFGVMWGGFLVISLIALTIYLYQVIIKSKKVNN